jgi:hypothetical protein
MSARDHLPDPRQDQPQYRRSGLDSVCFCSTTSSRTALWLATGYLQPGIGLAEMKHDCKTSLLTCHW